MIVEIKQTSNKCMPSTANDINEESLEYFDFSNILQCHTEHTIVKPCSRLSTARGPRLGNIQWIQANWFKQYHAHTKTHVTLTFSRGIVSGVGLCPGGILSVLHLSTEFYPEGTMSGGDIVYAAHPSRGLNW